MCVCVCVRTRIHACVCDRERERERERAIELCEPMKLVVLVTHPKYIDDVCISQSSRSSGLLTLVVTYVVCPLRKRRFSRLGAWHVLVG
mgnify:CR=1 FL=1